MVAFSTISVLAQQKRDDLGWREVTERSLCRISIVLKHKWSGNFSAMERTCVGSVVICGERFPGNTSPSGLAYRFHVV